MTRRSFLSSFVKGAVLWTAAPQIVTHGLGLVKATKEPRFIYSHFSLIDDLVYVEYLFAKYAQAEREIRSQGLPSPAWQTIDL